MQSSCRALRHTIPGRELIVNRSVQADLLDRPRRHGNRACAAVPRGQQVSRASRGSRVKGTSTGARRHRPLPDSNGAACSLHRGRAAGERRLGLPHAGSPAPRRNDQRLLRPDEGHPHDLGRARRSRAHVLADERGISPRPRVVRLTPRAWTSATTGTARGRSRVSTTYPGGVTPIEFQGHRAGSSAITGPRCGSKGRPQPGAR